MSAYMLIDRAGTDGTTEDDLGQITAHIDGFLALDGVNDQIYLKADYGIYRVPIYDAAMLAAEAESMLNGK